MRRIREEQLGVIILAVFGMLLFSPAKISEVAPEGVLKQAVHSRLSADWLDPSTASHAVSAHLPLYLFHDALVKPMPDDNYSPCLAKSYNVSTNSKVYEFSLWN